MENKKAFKIVCMSDTHTKHDKITVPNGDFFIHAGDFTKKGTLQEIAEFNLFLKKLPHKYKIIVAGNHDWAFETHPKEAQDILLRGVSDCYYLQDEALCLENIRFYGSPWQPIFHHWAFNLERGEPLKGKWDMIPSNTDILITHGPPWGILDRTIKFEHVGCADLYHAVQRLKPKYHIFGHIHEARGMVKDGDTQFINAANVTRTYRPAHDPITFEFVVD